ncbi:MAG TPA: hypothetical protein PLD54_05190, partial [Candidatus Levybacteria bacterium]|nr:hypothetical protein [Candidatus Levybacteria bacterium]
TTTPTLPPSPTPTNVPEDGFGVIGDSGSDEYRADDNRAGSSPYAATTLSWVELLAKKGINLGPWSNSSRGEPRRRGYEYNFARSAHKVHDGLMSGQHTGMKSLIQAGKVSYVHIEFNGNDYAEWNGEYEKIYNGTTSGTALQAKLDAIISDYTTILDTVINAGNVQVQVATFPDLNMDPGVVARFPNATNRQRVTNFVNSLNEQLVAIAQSRSIAVFDTGNFFMTEVASRIDANGFINFAGEKIDTKTVGDEPHHMILSDTIHAGTVPNGLIANAIVSKFNSVYNTSFPLLTESEILINAGIQTNNPTPTPTSTPTPTPNVTPTLTPSPTASPTVTPTPTESQVLSIQVNSSSDDANQVNSTLALTDPLAWLGTGGSTTESYSGLRFNSVTIPKNALITSAYLELYSPQNQWVNIGVNIGAEAISDSPTFSTANKITQRTLTQQRVNHNSNTLWTSATWYQFENIAPIIQEVINRSDWQQGNSISIIIKGTQGTWGRKFFASYDASLEFAPRLVISYQ